MNLLTNIAIKLYIKKDENMDMKIDKDIVNSLYGFYFKNIEDKISAASNRAYRDFCRTFKIDKEFKNIKNELKEKVTNKFKEKIKFIIEQDNIDRKTFDDWHCDVCDNIIKIYMKKI